MRPHPLSGERVLIESGAPDVAPLVVTGRLFVALFAIELEYGEVLPYTCGERSAVNNAAVGGLANSKHLTADAVDVRTRDMTAGQVNLLCQLAHKHGLQFQNEGTHLHLEVG